MEKRKRFSNQNFSRMGGYRLEVVISLFLILSTLTVYWQIRNHDFVNYDDREYVTHNRKVQDGWTIESVKWAFTTRFHKHWHPLTWLSHMTDHRLFGLDPGWHHLSSLFLHIANTLLLFFVFKRMTGTLLRSAFVAALFALHPLHVESVAWVSDRKDLLSGFFWMVTMWTYVYYSEGPAPLRYFLALVSFVMGLLAKPMAVTLPLVLLLLDYWPLKRFVLERSDEQPNSKKLKAVEPKVKRGGLRGLVWEKAGFFAFLAVSAVVTLSAMGGNRTVGVLELIPTERHFANTLFYYVSYIEKMFWPASLAIPYPRPDLLPIWQIAGSGLLLLTITVLVCWKGRGYPYLPVGWLWYLITLLPVIGVVRFGPHAMADRYTYIPLIGLFIMIAWGVPDILSHWRHGMIVQSVTAGAAVLALMICAWFQVRHWENTAALFNHSVKVTTDNYVAHYNLGTVSLREGDIAKARRHLAEAVRIKPNYLKAHNNLGTALLQQGKVNEAIRQFSEALRINPDYAEAHNNLGTALLHQGNLEEANRHFAEALRIDPEYAAALHNLGSVLFRQGDLDGAIRHYSEAVRLEPNFARWQCNLGMALLDVGEVKEAIRHLSLAVGLDPDNVEGLYNLGVALVRNGDFKQASQHFSKAVRIDPNHVDAHVNLGGALLSQGELEEAIRHFSEALHIKPDHAEAHMNMGTALASQGKLDEAIAHLSEAVQINPEHARAHNNLGIALASIGKLEEAIRHFSEAVRIDPEDAEAQNNLGTALASIGKLEEAIRHFSEAVRINPNHENARNNLELALKMAGKSEEVLETIQKP